MKKVVSLFLSTAIFLSFTTSVMAEAPKEDVGNRVGYAEYSVDELVGEEGIMPRASSSKDVTAGPAVATLNYGAVGTVESVEVLFDITNLPDGAKIKNLQAWNPAAGNITQSTYTTIDSIRFLHDGNSTENFKYWVIKEPTSRYPCNSTALNGEFAEGKYQFKISGTVFQNNTGFDGFTVRGTKIRR